MHALPFLLALLSAAVLAPAVLRTLAEGAHTRPNYREHPLPFPFGVLIVAAALIALIPLVLLARLASSEVFHPELLPIALYALGVATLGLIDDTLGEARAGRSVASGAIDQSARLGGDALRTRSAGPARLARPCSRGAAR